MGIDALFEEYYRCSELLYGHEVGREGRDVTSEAELAKIRRQQALMREKYVREVNLVPVEHRAVEDDTDGIESRGRSSVVVPAKVGDAGPGVGRGLFAAESISKGTLVVDLDNGSAGVFKDADSWRRFAATLPREEACNFIEWSWVQTIPPENDEGDVRNGLTILIAFDESNLMNSADWDDVEANVRCGVPLAEGGGRGPCSNEL
ncbi:hypothetical protein ACHAWF_015221 [Thalassiosira exigua]